MEKSGRRHRARARQVEGLSNISTFSGSNAMGATIGSLSNATGATISGGNGGYFRKLMTLRQAWMGFPALVPTGAVQFSIGMNVYAQPCAGFDPL